MPVELSQRAIFVFLKFQLYKDFKNFDVYKKLYKSKSELKTLIGQVLIFNSLSFINQFFIFIC
ncbi:hypothetical protein LV84_02113 [Algoriphagus ratkowskyi]|uniref:Uncharacterized protein n=1 Tax=Algoriphagus ratkowskyi TaxID=57028 RepID=A0A2W7T1B4_9BACT|nr:hypothetical protein LV84_02113 [Algoriphagus ratkowskyi]